MTMATLLTASRDQFGDLGRPRAWSAALREGTDLDKTNKQTNKTKTREHANMKH